ncbi:hypothetical protein DYGSA30_30430 [Dyella sp. GSA-30]|nr:hypothetical protein DYGSA30_30430 [Dyella sp. GSA-30]
MVSALPFLQRAVDLIEKNPGNRLSFVYRTTAGIISEKHPEDRPADESGLRYWGDVQRGADAVPLIDVLRRLAAPDSSLGRYLARTSVAEITEGLINAIAWATNEPGSPLLQAELSDRIAAFAHDELGQPWTDGTALTAMVIDAVTRTSFNPEKALRRLTRTQLALLLKPAVARTIPAAEYQQLKRDATLARTAHVGPLNREIELRLTKLRKSRVFLGDGLQTATHQLAADVREDGPFALVAPSLRSLVLSWCARLMTELDADAARRYLLEAISLGGSDNTELVQALLLGKTDSEAALQSILHRTDPAANTIRYLIHRRADVNPFEWLQRANLQPTDFDPDGNFMVLWDYLQRQQWTDATDWAGMIPEQAFEQYPALYWGTAITLLANSISDPLQSLALDGVPLTRDVPLRADASALLARQRSADLFQRFADAAGSLDIPHQQDAAVEYSLWLRLSDQQTRVEATLELAAAWESSGHNSRWIPLVLMARLPLDIAREAEEIDQRSARYGSINFLDARARLALAIAMPPAEWVDNLGVIRDALTPHFTTASLEYLEIQALAGAGRIEAAKEALERASAISGPLATRLQIEIGEIADAERAEIDVLEGTDGDPIANLRNRLALYQKLRRPAAALKAATELFAHTHNVADAEAVVALLKEQGDWRSIERFLEDQDTYRNQSNQLLGDYLQALFLHGRWQDLKNIVAEHPNVVVNPATLQVQVAVLSGDWDALGVMLENALLDDQMPATEQLMFANLAVALGRLPAAKRLTYAAATKSENDVGVMLGCYTLAVNGRWENESSAARWMQRAIELSGPEGPVQAKSLEDLIAMAPEWHQRVNALNEGLAKGEIYLGLVAQQLSRPLTSIVLGTALANRRESSFAKRQPVGCFAGARKPDPQQVPDKIAIDQTAFLTLAYLGLLPKVLSSFDAIWVPHMIGAWLFEEQREIKFHQPSRIFDAKQLLNRIAAQAVHLAQIDGRASHSLVAAVGSELADLIHAAEVDRSTGTDAYVIRVAPVHLMGSLGHAEADLSAHASVLRSLHELVAALAQSSLLDDRQRERSSHFLRGHDTGWPFDQSIAPGALLYLDDVSVAHLHTLGLWESAGEMFRLRIHPETQREALALSQQADSEEKLEEALEEIRRFLVEGQKAGKVQFLWRPAEEAPPESSAETRRFLMLQALEPEAKVEAIVVDDRAANRYGHFSYPDGRTVAFISSLDVIEALKCRDALDASEYIGIRNELRRSGYVFIPVVEDELDRALDGTVLRGDQLVESSSIRAIRENYLLAQASNVFRFPLDANWMLSTLDTVTSAITTLWSTAPNDTATPAKADLLLTLTSWDGFLAQMPGEWTGDRMDQIDAIVIGRLLLNREVPASSREQYNAWLDTAMLAPLQESRPRVLEIVCVSLKLHFHGLDAYIAERDPNFPPDKLKAAAGHLFTQFVNEFPETIREQLFDDDQLLQKLGLTRSAQVIAHVAGEPTFDIAHLYEAAAHTFLGDSGAINIRDGEGMQWSVTRISSYDVECTDAASERRVRIQHAALVAADPSVRLSYLKELASDHALSEAQLSEWFSSVQVAPLEPSRFRELDNDLRDSVLGMSRAIESAFSQGGASTPMLIPLSPRYWSRLGMPIGQARTLDEFVSEVDARPVSSVQDLSHALLWSSHPRLAPITGIQGLSAAEVRDLIDRLLPVADLWSLTGLIEAVVSRDDAFTDLLDPLTNVVETFASATRQEGGRLRLTIALGSAVDQVLHCSGLLAGYPPFWRRYISFSHAALIERCALSTGLDSALLSQWGEQAASQFQSATLPDLVTEPRWNSFMFVSGQLEQELIGRVLTPLEGYREQCSGRLKEILFGEHEGSLQSRRMIFFSVLPGPLEGAVEPPELLSALLEELRATLNSAELPAYRRLVASAHLAFLGKVPDGIWDEFEVAMRELVALDVSADERELWNPLCLRLSHLVTYSRRASMKAAFHEFLSSRKELDMGLRLYAGITACGVHCQWDDWGAAIAQFLEPVVGKANSKEATQILQFVGGITDAHQTLRVPLGRTLARLHAIARGLR